MAQRHHDPAGGFPDGRRHVPGPGGPVTGTGGPLATPLTGRANGGAGPAPDPAAGPPGGGRTRLDVPVPATLLVVEPGGGARPGATAGDVLSGHLHAQATAFLRSLRLHRESGSDADDAVEAARQMRHAARRIAAALHTYRSLTDAERADTLRTELTWLTGVLSGEHVCSARLERLRGALHRLSGGTEPGPAAESGDLAGKHTPTVGAARAGALLERQLTLARTRAHTAALQALGSSRFHAVADEIALLASEVPLSPAAGRPAQEALLPLVEQAHRRLVEAVGALPLGRAGHPYNADALGYGLAANDPAGASHASERQDAPWEQVRLLVRLRRYAQEVLDQAPRDDSGPEAHASAHAPSHNPEEPSPAVRLFGAAQALKRHRDAAEAAAAAATAARTPRIAPATAYALGVLHADQRHDVEAARYAFGRLWQRWSPGGV